MQWRRKSFKIPEELTKENPVKDHTIEELKLKLGNKDLDSDIDMIPESQKAPLHSPAQPHFTEDGLIIPRKPGNPMLENTDRQNLHRELLFNQKIGKNVLNQKSELQRALEKHKDNVARKELDHHISSHELEKALADRIKRRQDAVVVECDDDKGLSKEFLEARAKLRTRTESK
ncbi:protein FAM107B isoform X2 [Photinus pyralis]|uniref:protein FAM107B isoform X2 n=1 Tax=Photinus pyralis TaxID=7054 RepID=UPI00126723F2|nr:protein FAM107B isoform X2 [Photinus pyralis]